MLLYNSVSQTFFTATRHTISNFFRDPPYAKLQINYITKTSIKISCKTLVYDKDFILHVLFLMRRMMLFTIT